jgi:hypothetical protein
MFCPPILRFCQRKKNNIFVWWTQLHREFLCDLFICAYIITQIGSSPLFFFIIP